MGSVCRGHSKYWTLDVKRNTARPFPWNDPRVSGCSVTFQLQKVPFKHAYALPLGKNS